MILVDTQNSKIWIWSGSEATLRKKFIANEKAKTIRDRNYIGYNIVLVEQGKEPSDFKQFIEELNSDKDDREE